MLTRKYSVPCFGKTVIPIHVLKFQKHTICASTAMEPAPKSRNRILILAIFCTFYKWNHIICTLGSGFFHTVLGLWSSYTSMLYIVHSYSLYSVPIYDCTTIFFNPFYSWWTVNISTLGLLQIILQIMLQWTFLSLGKYMFTFPSRITGL